MSSSYTYFSDNDVLLAKITPCFENGKIGIARNLKNGIGFGSSEYIVFRSRGELIPDYLYYFLARDQFRQDGKKVMTGAVGHKRVPKDFIENQEIPYPKSLSEQQQIVSILDETFAAIDKAKENAKKNLQNSRELFDSYLHSVFANSWNKWEEKKLAEVVSEMITGPFGSMLHKSDYVTDGVPVINPQNIVNGQIIPLQKTMVSQKTRERLIKYSLQEKNIIIARRGEMGRCAIVK